MDVEAQLLAEAKEAEKPKDRILNVFETGVAQTFFMEMKTDFDSTKIVDVMWEHILTEQIPDNLKAPRFFGR